MSDLPRKDFSKKTYITAISILLFSLLLIIWLGESWNYYRAYRFIRQHRQKNEYLISDISSFWMKPKLKKNTIIHPHHSIPYSILQTNKIVWILQHRYTHLQTIIPSTWNCQSWHFGFFRWFQLQKCHPNPKSQVTDLTDKIKQARIQLDHKPCKWHNNRCRFGSSWRWVGKKDNFPSDKILRHCIYAHPHAKKWMEIQFPHQKISGSLKFSYGFHDNKGSSIPMHLQIQLWNHPTKQKNSKISRKLFDQFIPHSPGWHTLHWTKKELSTSQPSFLVVRFWSFHVGAKAFCFKPLIFSPNTLKKKHPKKRLQPTSRPHTKKLKQPISRPHTKKLKQPISRPHTKKLIPILRPNKRLLHKQGLQRAKGGR